MTLKLPTTFRGIDGKTAYEKIINGVEEKKEKSVNENPIYEPFEFKNPNIVKSDYLQIPGTGKVISKYEVTGYNNLNWEEQHFKLQENGLYMPVVPLFMNHFMNVLNSYKSKGKNPLFDAAGNPISEKETEDIALHLLKDHIAVYGNQAGVWTYLDAYFEEQNNKMKMFSEHKVHVDAKGKKTLVPQKIEDLESCLTENCYSKLIFNNQGLPTTKHSNQNYKIGENIYFFHPINKMVARFDASPGRAVLYCSRNSSDRSPSLGVFAVAPDQP